MNKHNISLGEYCKLRGIDKEHIYVASKEDPTDFPKKVGHDDVKSDLITENLERTKISNEECSVMMYSKKEN